MEQGGQRPSLPDLEQGGQGSSPPDVEIAWDVEKGGQGPPRPDVDLNGVGADASSPRLLGTRPPTHSTKAPERMVGPKSLALFPGVDPRMPGKSGFGEWNPCGQRPEEMVEAGGDFATQIDDGRDVRGLPPNSFSSPGVSRSPNVTDGTPNLSPSVVKPWPSLQTTYPTKTSGKRQLSEAGRQVFLYEGNHKNPLHSHDEGFLRKKCLRPKLWWLLFGTFILVVLGVFGGLFTVSYWRLDSAVEELSLKVNTSLHNYAGQSKRAIQRLAMALDQRDVDGAKTAIERYLNVPLLAVRIMGEVMKDEFGLIVPKDPRESAKFLWSLYKTIPQSIEGVDNSMANRQRYLEGVFYADYTGTYVAYMNQGCRGTDDGPCYRDGSTIGSVAVDLRAGNTSTAEDFKDWAPDMTVDDRVNFFTADPVSGEPQRRFGGVDYDPSQRPWWKMAARANGMPAWTQIYDGLLYEDGGHPDIGFSVAVAKYNGSKPTMVAGAQLTLSHMTRILQQQETSDKKCLFIVDRNTGKMVASSQGLDKVRCRKPDCNSTRQFHWSEVDSPVVKEAMEALLADNGGSLESLPDRRVIPTERQTISHTLIKHGHSDFRLSWVLVHVQPTDVYTSDVNAELERAIETLRSTIDSSGSSLKTSLYKIGSICLIFIAAGMICLGFISHLVTKPIKAVVQDMKAVARLDLDNIDSMLSTERETLFQWANFLGLRIREVAEMRETFVSMTNGLRSFSRYMDPYVVQLVMMSGQQVQLGVAKAEATIFFSDIKGFTTIAETTEPQLLLSMLSEYLETMSGIIMKHQGVVGEFIGDGIMAWWNVPWELEDDTQAALVAALEQKRKLAELNPHWEAQGLPKIHARMGIARGSVLAGNIGSVNRMKFGLVGDSVNLASRLENMCKQYEVQILVDEQAAMSRGVQEKFFLRPVDVVRVKGRTQPTEVFELVGERSQVGVSALEKMYSKYCEDFADIHSLYRRQDFDEAHKALQEYMALWQDDLPSKLMEERLEAAMSSSPPSSWSYVRNLTEK